MKKETHYAIGVLMLLGEHGKMTSHELADDLGIEPPYILRILKKLKDHGIVETVQGVQGGIQLIKKPEEVTILTVIDVMGTNVKINRCLEEDHYCSRDATGYCQVHKVYEQMQKTIEERLNLYTIKDLIQKNKGE